MGRLCTAAAAIVDGRKRIEGTLIVYEDHCEFYGGGYERELLWKDIFALQFAEKIVKVPGFLFAKSYPALFLIAGNNDLTLLMKPETIKQVMETLVAEKERTERQRADERRAEQARVAEEAQKAEEARRIKAARIAKEARQAEALRKAEEARRLEEARRSEDARKAEEARVAQEARQAEIKRKAEETRRLEEARIAEEARQAGLKRKAEAACRLEETCRAEAARQKEEARKAREEQRRLAEQQRQQRLAEERQARERSAEQKLQVADIQVDQVCAEPYRHEPQLAQHTNMFTYDGIELSQEQAYAYRLAEGTNLNMFITGKAGTGKSVVLRYFRRHTKKRVAVLAPTGVAAINVGGQTIHSFFHLKPELLVDFDVNQIRGFDKLADKVGYFDTIVIDEISMVRADILDAMDAILRKARRREQEPFGGCQMIFVGDLYQLPPVVTNEDQVLFGSKYETPFFFGSAAVNFDNFNLIELTQVYRQSDGAFIDALNQIREGEAPDESLRLLNERADAEPPEEHCIILTLHRATARLINMENLHKLPEPSYTYEAEVRGEFLVREDKENQPDPPVERALELRVGAKIIMMVNDKNRRWVNGTMGVIEALHKDEIRVRINENVYSVNKYTWSKYRYEYNRVTKKLIQYEVGSYTQYPVALAYAITIHKSQGQTYDRVKIDFADRNAFAEGQTYVALSRCRSLDGLYLGKEIERKDIIVSQEVKRWMGEFGVIMAARTMPTFAAALPEEAVETESITVERIPDRPFEWTDDGRIKTNVPMVPKKMTGTRFAQILVPGRFNSPFEAWCEIMRVYEKPYEDNKYTRAGEAIQPIQTEYVQQDERFLEVADPQAVYGDNPEEQTGYDFFPQDDLFGGMWDAVGRTEEGEIARVYEMKTTGLKNARFWRGERFGIPMDKLLQGALYAYLLGLNAVTMVSSYLRPEDYDNPESYECSRSNTQVQEISLSEISGNFERDYIGKAKGWWEDHVVTGLSPRFDPVKDREIIEALERMVPRTQQAGHVSATAQLYRSPVGMTGIIDDFTANLSPEEFYREDSEKSPW